MHRRRILIIQGHPDPSGERYGRALAQSYAAGAAEAAHEVRTIDIALLDYPLLRTQHDWSAGSVAKDVVGAQQAIAWAEHIVLFFPLWLGTMPALLKGFLEQTLRPGFAVSKTSGRGMWKKALSGRSARVVVTMGMPALIYRWFFRAHALKGLERNILRFCGIAPVAESVIGSVEGSPAHRTKWLARMRELGRRGR
jgi:putative NADPH-quinone reductase